MANSLTPEEVEKWKAFAWKYYHAQQKLVAKRDQFRELLQNTDLKLRRLPDQPPEAHAEARAFLTLQRRLAELALASLESFQLEATVYQPLTAIHGAAFEARGLEMTLTTIRMDLLVYEALLRRLDGGEGAPALEGWDAEAEAIAAEPPRKERWEGFRVHVVNLRDAMATALAALEERGKAQTALERVEHLKGIKVPALNGLAYRVNTALTGIPTGEAWVKAVRDQIVPPLNTPPAGARLVRPGMPAAPRLPGATPGAAPGMAPGPDAAKKPMTDRLFDWLRPPG